MYKSGLHHIHRKPANGLKLEPVSSYHCVRFFPRSNFETDLVGHGHYRKQMQLDRDRVEVVDPLENPVAYFSRSVCFPVNVLFDLIIGTLQRSTYFCQPL